MEILEHDDDNNNKEDLVVEDVVVKVASQVDRAKHDLSWRCQQLPRLVKNWICIISKKATASTIGFGYEILSFKDQKLLFVDYVFVLLKALIKLIPRHLNCVHYYLLLTEKNKGFVHRVSRDDEELRSNTIPIKSNHQVRRATLNHADFFNKQYVYSHTSHLPY